MEYVVQAFKVLNTPYFEQVIQTLCLVTYFCAQAIYKVPVCNTFPTCKTI